MKHLSTRYAAERVGNSISRTIVERVDDTKFMQQHALSGYAGEQQDQIEHVHPYGFVSVVQKPTGTGQQRMGAEGFMGFMGGGRSHGAVFIAGDRRYRLYKLADGEIAMHDDQGQQVHFKRDGIYGSVPNSKKIKFQIMDDDKLPREDGKQLGQLQQATRPATISLLFDKTQFTLNHPNGAVAINCASFSVNASGSAKMVAGSNAMVKGGSGAILRASDKVYLKAGNSVSAKSLINKADPPWADGAEEPPDF
ncbi:phage baseplate assembly protein domain-containing protein [Bradyrhizobium japonicum]|uniref:phage baseplate assembly protein domain-containing protein n=1 Tax=Bradyrhizobium japonicum TaxID=375 RepID=UPI00041B70F9|nr:phage baseplate assembly protein [Bradyrhizobium japonicum]